MFPELPGFGPVVGDGPDTSLDARGERGAEGLEIKQSLPSSMESDVHFLLLNEGEIADDVASTYHAGNEKPIKIGKNLENAMCSLFIYHNNTGVILKSIIKYSRKKEMTTI